MRDRVWSLVLCGAVVVFAASMACSSAGPSAGSSARTDRLLEGEGLETLRIDEATVDEAATLLGLSKAEWTKTDPDGLVEMRTPQLLRLAFVPPESGEGPPLLYAVRANLWEPVYTGKTRNGIGFLDSLEDVLEAYGPSDAEWVRTNGRIHYYAEQGVIITTRHPSEIQREIYAAARAALGKQPDEGPASQVVTGIIVVSPFMVIKAAETKMARQQVISTRPETTLRIAEEY